MNGGEVMGAVSLLASLIVATLTFVSNRRANRTREKKLSFEEQRAADDRDDDIAERRRLELNRLYERVDKLEKTVEDLQKNRDEQADELERTNGVLADVRRLFVRYTKRVERAWAAGHTMPALTTEEQELLEITTPVRSHAAKLKDESRNGDKEPSR